MENLMYEYIVNGEKIETLSYQDMQDELKCRLSITVYTIIKNANLSDPEISDLKYLAAKQCVVLDRIIKDIEMLESRYYNKIVEIKVREIGESGYPTGLIFG